MIGNEILGYDLLTLNEATVLIRLMLATLCGGIIGFERTKRRRSAGIRTYILVCLGSVIVMMTSQFVNQFIGSTDPTRMGAQVISGIGFIGVGTILVTRYHQVKGLTTAAGLWTAACMGLAIGVGFYFGSILTCLFVSFVMTLLNKLQRNYIFKSNRVEAYVIFETFTNVVVFISFIKNQHLKIEDFETTRMDNSHGVGALVTLTSKEKFNHNDIIAMLATAEGVVMIEEV